MRMNLPEQRAAPEALVAFAKQQIQEVLNHVNHIEFIMICSSDGFELASVSKRYQFHSSKLAAVSSSILAMVSAFLSEINLIGCQSITLDAENGKAVLTAVPCAKHPMLIVTLSSKEVLLGQLLYHLKEASQAIIQQDQS